MSRRSPRNALSQQLKIPTPPGACNCDLTSETAAPLVGDVLLALVSPADAVVLAIVAHAAERWRLVEPGVWEPLPYRAPPELRLTGVVTYASGRDPEPLVLSRAQLAPISTRLITSPTWGPAFARGAADVSRMLVQLRPDDIERSHLLGCLRRWSYEARQRWGVAPPTPPPVRSERSLRRRGLRAGEAHRLAEAISRPRAPVRVDFCKPLPTPPPDAVQPLDRTYTPGV